MCKLVNKLQVYIIIIASTSVVESVRRNKFWSKYGEISVLQGNRSYSMKNYEILKSNKIFEGWKLYSGITGYSTNGRVLWYSAMIQGPEYCISTHNDKFS